MSYLLMHTCSPYKHRLEEQAGGGIEAGIYTFISWVEMLMFE